MNSRRHMYIHTHKKNEVVDMTQGGILGKFIVFAIPLIAANFLQQCFNAADIIVIGQFAGTDSLAAVSSNGPIINLFLNLFIGLAVGVNVVVAQAIGEKDFSKAQNTVHTSYLLGTICGVVIGALGIIMTPLLLTMVKLDSTIVDKASLYLMVYFTGTPAVILYNFGAAILRAKGDGKRPLLFLVISGILNAGLNIFFVTVFNMDVLGVALATIISQYLSVILVTICLLKETDCCKLIIKKMRFHKAELLKILGSGVPSGLNGMMFSVSNVIIQSAVNNMGSVVTAGNATGSNIESFVYVSMNSIYSAVVTFVGQNYGAGKFDRIKRVTFYGLVSVTLIGLSLGFLALVFGEFLCSIFSPDPEVINLAMQRMRVILPTYFLCGIMDVGTGCLRGIGHSTTGMIISFFGACVFRLIWVYTVFAATPTLFILYISYPISWIATALVNHVIFTVLFVRMKKKQRSVIAGEAGFSKAA